MIQLTGAAKVRTTHMWLAPLFYWLDEIAAAINAIFGTAWLPVRVITQTALPANTYNATTKTKTASANGALTIDGVPMSYGDRFWDQSSATGSQRGLFVVTNPGSASTPWTAQRATDANTSGAFTYGKNLVVVAGTVGSGTKWQLLSQTFTLDTTTPMLAQVSGPVSRMSGQVRLTTPPTADLVSVVAQANLANSPCTIAAQPVYPCKLQLAITDADSSCSGTIAIVGTGANGQALTENITVTPAGTHTYTSANAYAHVTSITPNITGITVGTDKLSVGQSSAIGLPMPSSGFLAGSLSVWKENVDAADEAVGTVDTTAGTITPTTAPNGIHNYDIWYSYAVQAS